MFRPACAYQRLSLYRLWEILGEGEVWSLADYAARFFEQHGRPLRIAVDEANWRFCNLTPAQVAAIQADEPAANLVEKVILWRLLRGAKLNIQFIFISDGMSRPGKRRRKTPGGNKLDYALVGQSKGTRLFSDSDIFVRLHVALT